MDISFDGQAVIKELGLEGSDPVFQNQVVARISELLNQRLMQHFQEQMSPKDFKDFAALADDDAKAQSWLATRFPDYQKWISEDLSQIVALMKQQIDTTLSAVHQQRQQ